MKPVWTRLIRYGGGYSIFDENNVELSFNLSSASALLEAKEKTGIEDVELKEMVETENGWEPE